MTIIKEKKSNALHILMILAFTMLISACSSDDAAPAATADPKNCKTPCIQTTPDLGGTTTVDITTGATITMILTIDGDASLIELASSTFSLEPVDTSGGQGRLVLSSNDVVDTNANTLTMNFIIPITSVTGGFYPKLIIGVAASPDPNDPGQDAPNYVEYTLDTTNSTTKYSFSEVIAGESSTYTSNGIFLGTVATDIVMPIVTLQ